MTNSNFIEEITMNNKEKEYELERQDKIIYKSKDYNGSEKKNQKVLRRSSSDDTFNINMNLNCVDKTSKDIKRKNFND